VPYPPGWGSRSGDEHATCSTRASLWRDVSTYVQHHLVVYRVLGDIEGSCRPLGSQCTVSRTLCPLSSESAKTFTGHLLFPSVVGPLHRDTEQSGVRTTHKTCVEHAQCARERTEQAYPHLCDCRRGPEKGGDGQKREYTRHSFLTGTALAAVHDRVVLQQLVTGRCDHALVLSPGPPESVLSGDPCLPLSQSLKVLRLLSK